jgi:hypothetical protein
VESLYRNRTVSASSFYRFHAQQRRADPIPQTPASSPVHRSIRAAAKLTILRLPEKLKLESSVDLFAQSDPDDGLLVGAEGALLRCAHDGEFQVCVGGLEGRDVGEEAFEGEGSHGLEGEAAQVMQVGDGGPYGVVCIAGKGEVFKLDGSVSQAYP